VHYYFQLAQQHQAALQQTAQQSGAAAQTTAAIPTIQIVQPATGQVQTVSIANPAVEQVLHLPAVHALFKQSMMTFPLKCLIKPIILLIYVTHNFDMNTGVMEPMLQIYPENYSE
jgi:hypothetical protein